MAEARTTEEGDLGRPVATARMLITGAGGFIGRALRRAAPDARHADHRALLEHPGLLDGMAVLIHAGRDPHLGSDR